MTIHFLLSIILILFVKKPKVACPCNNSPLYGLSFSELLELDNAVTIHQRNLQVLATEIFKVKNNLSPKIMKQVFDFQEPYYNLRSETSQFKRENIKTTQYGIQSNS